MIIYVQSCVYLYGGSLTVGGTRERRMVNKKKEKMVFIAFNSSNTDARNPRAKLLYCLCYFLDKIHSFLVIIKNVSKSICVFTAADYDCLIIL